MDSITDNDKRKEKKARNLDMRQARHFSRDHFFPFLAPVLIFTSRYTDSAAKEEQTDRDL